MKKLALAALGILFILLAAWVFTGGVSITNYWYYGDMMKVPLGPGRYLYVSVDTNIERSGLVFVLFSHKDYPPYAIDVSGMDHDTKDSKELRIDELALEFEDGTTVTVVKPEHKWCRPFKPHVSYNSTSKGVIQNDSRKVEHSFEGVVDRPRGFRLRLRGRLTSDDGTTQEIDAVEQFSPTKRHEVTTGWKWVSNI